MQINMFMVRVRFVEDSKGPLEAKPKRVVITIARDHGEALQKARAQFAEMSLAGVTVAYDTPSQLSDTFALESFIYSGT
jgi:hypothetical protein